MSDHNELHVSADNIQQWGINFSSETALPHEIKAKAIMLKYFPNLSGAQSASGKPNADATIDMVNSLTSSPDKLIAAYREMLTIADALNSFYQSVEKSIIDLKYSSAEDLQRIAKEAKAKIAQHEPATNNQVTDNEDEEEEMSDLYHTNPMECFSGSAENDWTTIAAAAIIAGATSGLELFTEGYSHSRAITAGISAATAACTQWAAQEYLIDDWETTGQLTTAIGIGVGIGLLGRTAHSYIADEPVFALPYNIPETIVDYSDL